jgi:hypothetical protein
METCQKLTYLYYFKENEYKKRGALAKVAFMRRNTLPQIDNS